MYYIFQHKLIVFLIFLLPLAGWLIAKFASKKLKLSILLSAAVFFLPVLFGYSYIIDIVSIILFYVIAACLLSYLNIIVESSVTNIAVCTISMAAGLFLFVGLLSMAGVVHVEKEWKVGNYKINYIRDQGFSGGPLHTYQLYEYSTIPIFIKHVEEKIDNDTTKNCEVKFEYKNFQFDKCLSPPKEYHYDYGFRLF
ncbi:hypothetical protein [Mucilaginibacter sp.]|uniref:hypothetical protein n=1 Tax=Mucilaginibacter sp. TaxID=1882438 RepID=UPI00262180C9|nr:hypothetical protein [Mucilaginibacter sp.]MDB5128265.1 hypothetical protein [Mucilaginibacter sp.]